MTTKSEATSKGLATVNPHIASLSIDRWLADPETRSTMIDMFESVTGRDGSVAARMRGLDLHRYIKPQILETFRRGEFVLLRIPHLSIIPIKEDKPKEEQPQEEPAPRPTTKTTWVEIALVDGDDKPVAGMKYLIELPDGTTRTGTLGDNGKARVEGIDPGNCTVTFPDLDGTEWEAG